MDQFILALGLRRIKRLLLRIKNEVCARRAAHAPAHDALGKNVDHKRRVQPVLPGLYIGAVGHPKLIGPVCFEDPVDAV